MSTTSPTEQYGQNGSKEGSGASEDGKSPLSMSLGFLKNLTEKKSTRADGQPPKRRGPKPDSKPAMTRRQELNRQAQRTHRERKELYIKALEQEILRLKESFSTVTKDKETLAEENRQLKALLAQHGIAWNGTGGVEEYQHKGSIAYTSSGSLSGSYAPASQSTSPPPKMPSQSPTTLSPTHPPPAHGAETDRSMAHQQQSGVDYDQAGIDFVLQLERPCMDHMQFLVQGSSEGDFDFSGHALMASCPPYPFGASSNIPFGHCLPHGDEKTPKTWDISKPGLANLMDLSKRLNLEGEITPVMAWGMILGHERFSEFGIDDFEKICVELGSKIRCYGFGAVLEEFEVRDAIANVFSAKLETSMM